MKDEEKKIMEQFLDAFYKCWTGDEEFVT